MFRISIDSREGYTTDIANDIPNPGVLDLLHRVHNFHSFDERGGVSSHVPYPYDDLIRRISSFDYVYWSIGEMRLHIVAFLRTDDTLGVLDSQSHGLLNEDVFTRIGSLDGDASLH